MLPPAGKSHNEYVIVGAHYDHLGHGETGGMQRKGEEGQIHYGADDNASGTAVVLELADALARERLGAGGSPAADHSASRKDKGLVASAAANRNRSSRGIIFAFWSGEEIGLIGSSYFVEHPVIPLAQVAAYVNFDMVGRLSENKIGRASCRKQWRTRLSANAV